jgi:hypothetical protein
MDCNIGYNATVICCHSSLLLPIQVVPPTKAVRWQPYQPPPSHRNNSTCETCQAYTALAIDCSCTYPYSTQGSMLSTPGHCKSGPEGTLRLQNTLAAYATRHQQRRHSRKSATLHGADQACQLLHAHASKGLIVRTCHHGPHHKGRSASPVRCNASTTSTCSWLLKQ